MIITTSVENYIFWVGIFIIGAISVVMMARLWFNKIQEHDSNIGLVTQYGLLFFITTILGAGLILLTMGNPRWEPPQTENFSPPSEIRQDFKEQVEADKKATLPQTRADLEEERKKTAEEAVKSEEKAEANKDKATFESIQDFRERMMKSRTEESP